MQDFIAFCDKILRKRQYYWVNVDSETFIDTEGNRTQTAF